MMTTHSAPRRPGNTNGHDAAHEDDAPREPVYLASQLASICDVDLKTIHNWCDRNDDPEAPAELECFRTPGGHLRFKHSSVLRFLTRWGYPIPNELLQDRPHALMVEPDDNERRRLIAALGLVRPGDEPAPPTDAAELPSRVASLPKDATESTLGLWATPRYYLHLWDDPHAALVALGERTGAGAPPDLAVVTLPMPGLDAKAWIHTARTHVGEESPNFVLLTSGNEEAGALASEKGVVGVVPRARVSELRTLLDSQAQQLLARVNERNTAARSGQPRRRIPIAPKEPIFVASQVANIWNVDLKTVHNWVERGDMEAFRTPGRHLRFRRRSLLHFLRRYNMAIPQDLVSETPKVMLLTQDAQSTDRLRGDLARFFDVIVQPDLVAGLADIGTRSAGANLIDAVVVSLPAPGVQEDRWLSALLRHPDTRYTRIVVIGGSEAQQRHWQELGVLATVQRENLDQVTPVLEKALGLTARP